jgi:hypothetical protein
MLRHNNELCYVASGLQFAKFLYKDVLEEKEHVEQVGRWLKLLDGANSHRFSVLFNAFTEKNLGAPILETIKPFVFDVHSDSGGLQIISRGMKISPEIKRNIYEIQAKFSDVAMSFDEIPVYTLVNKSVLKDAGNKVFDRSRLEICAKETAKNITEQIQYFLDEKTSTRPLAIIQGNDLETAMIWSDVLFKEIPKSMHEVIKGIAIGSPALGVGELEEVKKNFWFTQIPFDIKEKHLHLLGVGAMKRFVPTLVFVKSGIFKDTFLSYDSTTHTSMNIYGRYYYGKKPGRKYQIVFNRNYSVEYEEMFEDMKTLIPGLEKWCKDSREFHVLMNTSPSKYKEKYGSPLPVVMVTIAHAVSCIYNFTKHVEDALEDDEILYEMIDEEATDSKSGIKYVDTTKRNVYKELAKVKTLEEYRYWEAHLGRFLDSKPARSNHTTLDAFFD